MTDNKAAEATREYIAKAVEGMLEINCKRVASFIRALPLPAPEQARCEVCNGNGVISAPQNAGTSTHPCPRGCTEPATDIPQGHGPACDGVCNCGKDEPARAEQPDPHLQTR